MFSSHLKGNEAEGVCHLLSEDSTIQVTLWIFWLLSTDSNYYYLIIYFVLA